MATLYLDDFPGDMLEKAESRAAVEGITLADLVVEAIRRYLESPITLDVEKVIVKRSEPEGQ